MNAKNKKDIIRLYQAIEEKAIAAEAERCALDCGSYEWHQKGNEAYGLSERLRGITETLALIAPDHGPLKGFGLIIKNGVMRRRIGALTIDDLIK